MAILAKFLSKIVKNDAMRNDPPEIYGWRVIALVCASWYGLNLYSLQHRGFIGAIGGVLAMRETQDQYGYGDAKQSVKDNNDQNIVSTLQGGCFVACFITPWLTDRYGRRLSLICTGIITTIGVVMQAASASTGNLAAMFVGRFVAGLGVGAASMLTPLYVSECAPRAVRGGLTSLYQLFIVTGTMLAFWINYGSLAHIKGKAVYVVPLVLQAVPAVCLSVGMMLVPESPRWCAKQDDWERATSVLSGLRGLPADHSYVQNEIRDMAQQLEHERALVGDATTVVLLKEMWLIPSNRKRALISVALMICQQMTGVNAVNYYAPQIFKALGLSGDLVSLLATGVYGIVKVTGCLCFLLFAADSLGRRRSLLWTSAAQAVVMFIVGIYGRVQPPIAGEPITGFGIFAMACIYLWAVFFQFGWGPCCWILVSEIPTARLRALNVALGAATQWLFNFIIARTVLEMKRTMGTAGYGMFFLFGTFCAMMGTFVWFFIPETKGLSLEKMDELFGSVKDEAKKVHAEDGVEAPRSIREENVEKS
ncbi:related to quinate transport protein [Cephalotrichum gorgonifer]|uniref:Related to quinate transport protein n=1 Tax=Cephalotrichum gorgonifer TaxID=2041049 RepID=A0AAE8MUE2_9PEZI|nr:related to quinate transport protein [Cephalotrichum gorgonifer]